MFWIFWAKKLCECKLDIWELRSWWIDEISKQSDKCNKCALDNLRWSLKDKTSWIIWWLYAEKFMNNLLKK